jgi:hypothetical protein
LTGHPTVQTKKSLYSQCKPDRGKMAKCLNFLARWASQNVQPWPQSGAERLPPCVTIVGQDTNGIHIRSRDEHGNHE